MVLIFRQIIRWCFFTISLDIYKWLKHHHTSTMDLEFCDEDPFYSPINWLIGYSFSSPISFVLAMWNVHNILTGWVQVKIFGFDNGKAWEKREFDRPSIHFLHRVLTWGNDIWQSLIMQSVIDIKRFCTVCTTIF